MDAFPTLLQYPLEFRAVGRNGKLSRFFAIVARSFDIFDGEAVRRLSRLAALGLVQEFEHPHRPTTPLGVWAMRSSGDDNGLIIVAHGLVPEGAGQFGMIPLAPAAN